MSPDQVARTLRHLEGDTAFKLNEEGLDRTYLLGGSDSPDRGARGRTGGDPGGRVRRLGPGV